MNKRNLEEGLQDVADDVAAASARMRREARRSMGRVRAGASEIAGELSAPMHAMGAFVRRRPLEAAAIALAGAWIARWLLGRVQHD